MSSLSRELLQRISEISEVLGAAFGILAATSVVVYLLANKPLRKLEAHDSDVLKGTVAEAQGKMAGLEKDAADAKAEMATQQTRAATAEKELLELRQKIKWRSITPDQRKKFLAAVANLRKGSVQITTAGGDSESVSFANELRLLLIDGKYSVGPVDVVPLLYPEFSVGLSLVIQSKTPLKELASDPRQVAIPENSPIAHGLPLGAALDAAGFVVPKERVSKSHEEDKVQLLVGTKP